MLRWIGFVVIVALMLLTAFTGISDGLSMTRQATGWQWVATVMQFGYSICAILALAAITARHRLATRFIQGWCIATILISALAPVVYGGASIAIGLLSGAAMVGVSALILWMWKHRPPTVNG